MINMELLLMVKDNTVYNKYRAPINSKGMVHIIYDKYRAPTNSKGVVYRVYDK